MMSDGSLSQDEIDALLFQGGGSSPEAAPVAGITDTDKDNVLSLLDKSKDAMGQTLSGMLGKTVNLTLGSSQITSKDGIISTISEEIVEVKLDYTGQAPGEHLYLIEKNDSIKIAGLMSGQDGIDLDAMALASIGEAISQITGTLLTSVEKQSGKNVSPSAPEVQAIPKAMVRFPEGEFVSVEINLNIEGDGNVKFIEIFDAPIVTALAEKPDAAPMGGMGMDQQQMMGQQQMQQPMMGQQQMQQPMMQQPMMGQQQMQQPMMGQQQMQQPMMGQQQMQQPMMGQQQMYQQQNVQGVQYPPLNQVDLSGIDSRNIGLLMDVSMELTVELGRTKWQIKDILGIGEGTIIELDKLAGEPVDILVNKNLIARGEVVVIDENFGVRVTEIVSAGAKSVES